MVENCSLPFFCIKESPKGRFFDRIKYMDEKFAIPYFTKVNKLPGTNYTEVKRNADIIFKQIKSKTKRRPYIRSAYFNKQKVFFDFFWQHLFKKSLKERVRRLKFFPCAIDLIKNSRILPTSKENVDNRNEILHRFLGQTKILRQVEAYKLRPRIFYYQYSRIREPVNSKLNFYVQPYF